MGFSHKRTEIFRYGLILIGAVLLSWTFFIYTPLGQAIQNRGQDLKIVFLSPVRAFRDDLLLVSVTEDTLATLPYRYPLDRKLLADALETLFENGAQNVILDILIDQASESNKDKYLRDVLVKHRANVVLAIAGRDDGLTEAQVSFLNTFTYGLKVGLPHLSKSKNDGVVRHLLSGKNYNGRYMASLTFALNDNLIDENTDPRPLIYQRTEEGFPQVFPTFEIQNISHLPRDWIEGKTVLIGADLPHEDRHRTPFSSIYGQAVGNLAGVQLHALTLAQNLDNRFPKVIPSALLLFITVFFAILGIVLISFDISIHWRILLALTFSFIVLIGEMASFHFLDMWFSSFAPLGGFFLSFIACLALIGQAERQRRQFLRSAFTHYVAPEVVSEIVDHPENFRLGGEKRYLTFVFTDMEEFTRMSETMSAEELAQFLNLYTDALASIVIKHGGTLDKFVGDGMNAIFGAPIIHEDHAQRAVEAALELASFGDQFAKEYRLKGRDVGRTRVGVHSGEAMIGNFGGQKRFQFTALGDSVNAASRLEGLNKNTGSRLCMSEATLKQINHIANLPVGRFLLKGKQEALRVFEPFEKLSADFSAAYLSAYKMMEQDTEEALALFKTVNSTYPGHGIVIFHVARLEKGETGTLIEMKGK